MRGQVRYVAMLIAFQVVMLLTLSVAAEDPEEGKNFVWVDLGKKNESLLLTQSEQGDGKTKPTVKSGMDCRENPWPYNGPGHNHMYFKIDDTFLVGGKHKAWIIMEYFDSNKAQEIDCQYDSNGAGPVGGAFRGARDDAFPILKPEGTDKWRVHIWYINKDGRFENRANGSDFRFSSHGKGPIWINRVWFSLIKPPDDFDPEGIFGIAKSVEWYEKLAVTWGQLKF
ncbi:TPA: hypothetical protein EYN98_18385 [Candidatus Poribacteria bacterium]|nr:hypothetical protein [Candidatus Poribacteria bacterium]HIA67975.1 hypothetical protein [Candidatus Poribacteria bacterium]